MPQKIEKELSRVEHLEREIENSIKNIEKQNSFSMTLFYAIFLGILSNIGASIIYEIHLKRLSTITQTIFAVVICIGIPVLIIMIVREFRKIKKQKQTLNLHLGDIREHKKRIQSGK